MHATGHLRRDGRVAEGARLESVFRGNSNVGSNPTLSAIAWSSRSRDARTRFLAELTENGSLQTKSTAIYIYNQQLTRYEPPIPLVSRQFRKIPNRNGIGEALPREPNAPIRRHFSDGSFCSSLSLCGGPEKVDSSTTSRSGQEVVLVVSEKFKQPSGFLRTS